MGGGSSKYVKATVSGGKKKVVIVGGSFGGKLIIQHLQALDPNEEQFDILVVDKQSHFEFICSNYKILCEEDTFKKHAISHNAKVMYAGVGLGNPNDESLPVYLDQEYLMEYNGIQLIENNLN